MKRVKQGVFSRLNGNKNKMIKLFWMKLKSGNAGRNSLVIFMAVVMLDIGQEAIVHTDHGEIQFYAKVFLFSLKQLLAHQCISFDVNSPLCACMLSSNTFFCNECKYRHQFSAC